MTCALLIGLSEYSLQVRLPSAETDVTVIKGICKEKLHIADENITTISKECDSAFIPTIVDQFCRDNSESDSCVFYYSGHGGVVDEGFGQNDFALYGTDGEPISLSKITNRLKAVFSHGLVILDSCHSGSARVDSPSFDFLKQSWNGFTVLASSESNENSHAGQAGCPSAFTSLLKIAFDVASNQSTSYFRISRVVDIVNAGMGFLNKANPLGTMHPVGINKYDCDGVFSTHLEPYEDAKAFEFDHSGFHFVVNGMNSHDYLRVRVDVLLHGPSEDAFVEVLPILKSRDTIEAIQRHPIFEDEKQKRLLSGKDLAYALFDVFPDEADMRIRNPKWQVHWANASVPYADLCRDPDYIDGPLKIERCTTYQDNRRGYEENSKSGASLAQDLLILYTRLRFLMEELGSTYDRVMNGKLSEEDLRRKCLELKALIDEAEAASDSLSYSADSDVLELDAVHLMGIAGALANIARIYSSPKWSDKMAEERLRCARIFLDMCVESHSRLFEECGTDR